MQRLRHLGREQVGVDPQRLSFHPKPDGGDDGNDALVNQREYELGVDPVDLARKLVIGAASEVRIRRWLVDEPRSRIDIVLSMVTGILRLLGEPIAASRTVEVQTRAAVASVRSTEWVVEATGAGTAVFSIEGAVAVRSPTGSVTLGSGDGTDVRLLGTPSPPVRWGQPRVERTLARVPF